MKKKLINVLRQVVAGLSPILYHYTNVHKLASILKENQFRLYTSLGTGAEEDQRKKQKFYYLSTTRHKLGGYSLDPGSPSAMLVLDGVKLGHKYSGDPVDYWGESFRKIDPKKFEAEDRLWSKEPIIKSATKYIKEIHLYVEEKYGKRNDVDRKAIRHIMIEAKKNNIPVFVYEDQKDFQTQNKKKTVDLGDLDLGHKEEPAKKWPTYDRRKFEKGVHRWLELYHKDKYDFLSKEAKRVLELVLYYYDHDAQPSFSNDIHNNRGMKDSGIPELIDILKKEKLSNAKEYLKFIQEKWTEIDKNPN